MKSVDQKASKANELFFVVDENDQPKEPLPRRLVHGHGVWHRVAHIWLYNDRGQILCQQRSIHKELNPGRWEAFFGGHIRPGESYEDAAERELHEELGITLAPGHFKLRGVYKFSDKTGYNNEFMGIFVIPWNGNVQDVTFDDREVEQVAWKSIPELKESITTQGEKNWVNTGYEIELLDQLSENSSASG